jgi:hypothetical protein
LGELVERFNIEVHVNVMKTGASFGRCPGLVKEGGTYWWGVLASGAKIPHESYPIMTGDFKGTPFLELIGDKK